MSSSVSCSNTQLSVNCDEVNDPNSKVIYGSVSLSSEFSTFVIISDAWPSFAYACKGFSDAKVLVCFGADTRQAWKSSMLG